MKEAEVVFIIGKWWVRAFLIFILALGLGHGLFAFASYYLFCVAWSTLGGLPRSTSCQRSKTSLSTFWAINIGRSDIWARILNSCNDVPSNVRANPPATYQSQKRLCEFCIGLIPFPQFFCSFAASLRTLRFCEPGSHLSPENDTY